MGWRVKEGRRHFFARVKVGGALREVDFGTDDRAPERARVYRQARRMGRRPARVPADMEFIALLARLDAVDEQFRAQTRAGEARPTIAQAMGIRPGAKPAGQ